MLYSIATPTGELTYQVKSAPRSSRTSLDDRVEGISTNTGNLDGDILNTPVTSVQNVQEAVIEHAAHVLETEHSLLSEGYSNSTDLERRFLVSNSEPYPYTQMDVALPSLFLSNLCRNIATSTPTRHCTPTRVNRKRACMLS